jgi:hypothetical protein
VQERVDGGVGAAAQLVAGRRWGGAEQSPHLGVADQQAHQDLERLSGIGDAEAPGFVLGGQTNNNASDAFPDWGPSTDQEDRLARSPATTGWACPTPRQL